MTTQELLASYAPCRHAVAFCELFIGANEHDATDLWADLRRLHTSLDKVVEIVRESMADTIQEDSPPEYTLAVEETATAEFRRYVRAKLGAM